MLNGGWPCGQGEGLLGSDGGDEGVLGEGRQIGEKGSEAVDREAVAGSAGGLLGDGGAGALGFGDDAGALRFGGLLVAVVVEHRRQALAHMPFQVVGEHANKDVAAHAIGQPVIDRPDLEVDRLDVIGLIWRSTVLMQRKARSTRLKDMAPKSKSDTPEIQDEPGMAERFQRALRKALTRRRSIGPRRCRSRRNGQHRRGAFTRERHEIS